MRVMRNGRMSQRGILLGNTHGSKRMVISELLAKEVAARHAIIAEASITGRVSARTRRRVRAKAEARLKGVARVARRAMRRDSKVRARGKILEVFAETVATSVAARTLRISAPSPRRVKARAYTR